MMDKKKENQTLFDLVRVLLKGLLRSIAVFVVAWGIMKTLEIFFAVQFKWSVVAAIWVLYYLLRYCVQSK